MASAPEREDRGRSELSESAASAVLNVHREGLLLAPTLNSILAARAEAAAAGARVELLVVADRIDAPTRAVLDRFAGRIDRVVEVDFGDLGASRSHGIAAAAHDWVFMHDGDDLFSSNWYTSFFAALAAGRIDPRTVYHTEIFARFGDILDVRRMLDSADPRFHPLFLASEWYYSNKAVLHRSLLAAFPLPHNDVQTGIGNEDWTWACDTLHGGVRHAILPGTVCFYRVKPAAKSLGLTPGMIHGASALFAPENVAALTRARERRGGLPLAFAETAAGAVDRRIGAAPLPDWFWAEVRRQGAFESFVTEFLALPAANRWLPLPNLHWNVVTATEYLMEGLDRRPKIILFASLADLRAAGPLVELILGAAAEHEAGRWQPVLVAEEAEETILSEARLAARFGAKLVSVRRLRDEFALAPWYFSRFLMRLLVQNPGATVLDLGSRVFADLFASFPRAILSQAGRVRMVFADAAPDLLAPAFNAIVGNAAVWRAHRPGPVPVTLRPEALALFADTGLWSRTFLDPASCAAIDRVMERRFVPQPEPARLAFAPLVAPGTPGPARETAPPPGFTRVRLPTGPIERLDRAEGGAVAYRVPGAWVEPLWFETAARLLAERPEIGMVVPQMTADLRADGSYICHVLDPARADLAFSALHERMMQGLQVPLVAMLRAPLAETDLCDAPSLARALYRLSADGPARATATGETLAIARDLRLYPEPRTNDA
jgi:hypothetical protein